MIIFLFITFVSGVLGAASELISDKIYGGTFVSVRQVEHKTCPFSFEIKCNLPTPAVLGYLDFDLDSNGQKAVLNVLSSEYEPVLSEIPMEMMILYKIDAWQTIMTSFFSPLFGQSLQGYEQPFRTVELRADLPTFELQMFFPLMDNGFKFSHAIGSSFFFVFSEEKGALSPESQDDFKAAFGFLHKDIMAYGRDPLNIIFDSMKRKSMKYLAYYRPKTPKAIECFLRILKRNEDPLTNYSILGLLIALGADDLSVEVKKIIKEMAPKAQEIADQMHEDAEFKKDMSELSQLLNKTATGGAAWGCIVQ